ncbi:MAG: hypothetical protein ACRDKU_05285, partial [Gaiellaceae bacterium]
LRESDLGERVTLAEARRRAPWLVEPGHVGAPDEVYFRSAVPGGQVTFLWGTKSRPQLLMTQATGEAFAEKMLVPGTDAEATDVDGKTGVWFSGAPHAFIYRDERGQVREETARLARNTLLWQDGQLTVRLEGELSKADALRIARSVE